MSSFPCLHSYVVIFVDMADMVYEKNFDVRRTIFPSVVFQAEPAGDDYILAV